MIHAVSLVLVLGGLGSIFGLLLALTDKKLAVKYNPLIDEVDEELPKGQCGSCGFAGCRQYAEAVVNRPEVPPNMCVPGGNDVAKIVARLVGKAAVELKPAKAVVMCRGVRGDGCNVKYLYDGLDDCAAAAQLYGGDKSCEYACLGFGNCSRACPYKALSMGPDDLPRVDIEKCVGCGICVDTCPRGVMMLVPTDAPPVIRCRNHDPGPVVRKLCATGCLSCKLCERACKFGAIHIENNLAVVDYTKCVRCEAPACLLAKCKPSCILPNYNFSVPKEAEGAKPKVEAKAKKAPEAGTSTPPAPPAPPAN
jgi:Na+-translocating ferredoxin:NAD+ oxidoreductase RNF subunit RnfB